MAMRLRLGLTLVTLCLLIAPASAHDGWLEAHPFLVERGQPVSIFLMFGNHGNDHRSYRLAGKWQSDYVTVFVTGPAGPAVNLTGQMTDLGDADDVGPKGPKGFHLVPFVASQEGVYIALATQARELQSDGQKFRSIATAKVVFAALRAPGVAAAARLTGFDRVVGGAEVLEIVPMTNPLALRSGESITLQVRQRGQLAPGQAISIIRRIAGAASAQTLTTDDRGQVTVVTGAADYYLARVSLEERTESGPGQVEKRVYAAAYVFPVYNP